MPRRAAADGTRGPAHLLGSSLEVGGTLGRSTYRRAGSCLSIHLFRLQFTLKAKLTENQKDRRVKEQFNPLAKMRIDILGSNPIRPNLLQYPHHDNDILRENPTYQLSEVPAKKHASRPFVPIISPAPIVNSANATEKTSMLSRSIVSRCRTIFKPLRAI